MSVNDFFRKELIGNLRVSADPFGIYRERASLARAMPGIKIYRGDEWWTRAADKIIQRRLAYDLGPAEAGRLTSATVSA